jgi:hypothetical protein
MMTDLLGALGDGVRFLFRLMAIGAGASVAFMVVSCVYTWAHELRSRCHICRTPAAVRFRSRHGEICDRCQSMLWHRTMGVRARDA